MNRKSFMSRFKIQLLQNFFPTFRVTEGSEGGNGAGEGAPPAASPEIKVETDDKPIVVEDGAASGTAQPVEEKKSSYHGNETVNPEKRPLRNFGQENMTEAEIDAFIVAAGADVFLTDEEIAKQADKELNAGKEKKEDKKEEDGSAKTAEEPGKKDEKKPEDEEFDENTFLGSVGLSKEEFAQIPEALQDKLLNTFTSSSKSVDIEKNEQYVEIKTKLDTTTNEVNELLEDPIVAARLEELQTGKNIIGYELPKLSKNDLAVLIASKTETEFEENLIKIMEVWAEPIVNNRMSVYEKKNYNKKMFTAASKVMAEVAKMDSRLAGKLTVENWADLTEKHPEWKEFEKGPKKIVDYCIKYGLKNANVAAMSPKALYAAIAAEEGWQQEKERKIAKNSIQKFLKETREQYKQAKSVSDGRRSAAPVSGTNQMGDSRESLVKALASGDTGGYEKLLRAAEGNPARLAELEGIERDAYKLRDEMRNSKR